MVHAAVSALAITLTAAAIAAVAGPATATAAPPSNDAPTAPDTFQPYTAENGTPSDLQATAELAEATPDFGVPRCLGPASFARTVWYLIPASSAPHEIAVEASGRTLDVVDLAAFVQPQDAAGPVATLPNACSGVGAGGANAAEEPTSGINLRVPAGRTVLVQVGRHGPVAAPDDERVLLSLDDQAFTAPPAPPPGDAAGPAPPRAHTNHDNQVPLFEATLTEEYPSQPAFPPPRHEPWETVPSLARRHITNQPRE